MAWPMKHENFISPKVFPLQSESSSTAHTSTAWRTVAIVTHETRRAPSEAEQALQMTKTESEIELDKRSQTVKERKREVGRYG